MSFNLKRIIEEEQRKAEDRPYSKRTATEALNAALNDPTLLTHAAFFAGRCSVSNVLTPEELELVKHKLTEGVKAGHAEEAKIVAQFQNGSQKKLTIIDWRRSFRLGTELEHGELKQYIKGFMPEGITFLGSLSGVGKTLLALSISRALRTGNNFIGVHETLEKVPVIYLCPEMGDRAFRQRLEKYELVNDPEFYCRTMSDDQMFLTDARLEIAIKELRPIVLLDTAIRFNRSDDENAARQNAAGLSQDIFGLLKWGSPAVVVLHHSPKGQASTNFMTLENVLRGTGDLGASADAVWGVQHDRGGPNQRRDKTGTYLRQSALLTRLSVECVKARDFEAIRPFKVQGRYCADNGEVRSYLNERHDLVVLASSDADDRIDRELTSNPRLTTRELAQRLGSTNHGWAGKKAAEAGWQKANGIWVKVAETPATEPEDEQRDLDLDEEQAGF